MLKGVPFGTVKFNAGRNNLVQMARWDIGREGDLEGTFWGGRMQTWCWEDALDDRLNERSLCIHLSAARRRWQSESRQCLQCWTAHGGCWKSTCSQLRCQPPLSGDLVAVLLQGEGRALKTQHRNAVVEQGSGTVMLGAEGMKEGE